MCDICCERRIGFWEAIFGSPEIDRQLCRNYRMAKIKQQAREEQAAAARRAQYRLQFDEYKLCGYSAQDQLYKKPWGYNLNNIGSDQRTTKEHVINLLNDALKASQQAYNIAVSAQPLAADIPAFQNIQKLSREIQDLMQQVSKLRGL